MLPSCESPPGLSPPHPQNLTGWFVTEEKDKVCNTFCCTFCHILALDCRKSHLNFQTFPGEAPWNPLSYSPPAMPLESPSSRLRLSHSLLFEMHILFPYSWLILWWVVTQQSRVSSTKGAMGEVSGVVQIPPRWRGLGASPKNFLKKKKKKTIISAFSSDLKQHLGGLQVLSIGTFC